MQKHFSCLILRPESILPACLSGSEADGGVRARATWESLHAPAGWQIRALRVGHLAAIGAPEGPDMRVEGTARESRGVTSRGQAPGGLPRPLLSVPATPDVCRVTRYRNS